MNQRHMELFGPDLGRGPFSPNRLEAAAVQIATALAQARAPLSRSDEELLAHGDFIRRLADRLAPDYAAFVAVDVEAENSNRIITHFRTALMAWSLLELWLADGEGGGETAFPPTAVTFSVGTVLETITERKHYRVLTSGTGVITATVEFTGRTEWRWAVTRLGRVYYSDELRFV